MKPEQLNCHDCAHSQANWLFRLTKFSAGYTCKLDYREPYTNQVTGRVTAGYYYPCSATRIDEKVCGRSAKAWTPRTKKDIFTLLKVQR